MFLIHPTITNDEMTKYAETIRSVIKKAIPNIIFLFLF